MNKIAFGKQVQKYRERIGYSQELLAEKIECSSIFISYIERGEKSPSLDTLIKLSNTLSISTDILLGQELKSYCNSELEYFEKRLLTLPTINQQKILAEFDALLNIEFEYYNKEWGTFL